jgi:hypothetical protein
MSLIDDYLKNVEPSKREQLQRIRMLAKEIVPISKRLLKLVITTRLKT